MASTTKKAMAKEIAKDVYEAIDKKGSYDANGYRYIGANDLRNLYAELEEMFESKYGVARHKKLSQYSWEEIASVVENGKASELFDIGDEKEFELYTGEKMTAVILGFDHDDKADGSGKAGITFGLKGIPDGWFEMNEDCTNEGGWTSCKMRNVYMQRFFKLLPGDLSGAIKPVTKKTSAGGGSSSINKTRDTLFLFSEIEVFGEREYSRDGEGEQYPYFVKEENRVKCRGRSAYVWWLRSPSASSSYNFCYVYSYGSVNGINANISLGAVFGFCI